MLTTMSNRYPNMYPKTQGNPKSSNCCLKLSGTHHMSANNYRCVLASWSNPNKVTQCIQHTIISSVAAMKAKLTPMLSHRYPMLFQPNIIHGLSKLIPMSTSCHPRVFPNPNIPCIYLMLPQVIPSRMIVHKCSTASKYILQEVLWAFPAVDCVFSMLLDLCNYLSINNQILTALCRSWLVSTSWLTGTFGMLWVCI